MTKEDEPVEARQGIVAPSAWKAGSKTAGLYLFAVAICGWIFRELTSVRVADLPYPFTYQGDIMFYHLLFKSILDHGWFLDNPALNAPEGLNFRDVPTSDNNFYLVLIKLLGLFTTNYALISNLFYLLSFPLTTGLALYVWRHFGLSRPVALCGSLLYTFLPFHFWRGQEHIFLASYYLVPLAVMLVLWVCLRRLSWDGWRKQRGHLL